MSNKYDYDVIIIGAGIGGLVCGCYLAKAGMKTLIVEKNAKPGGYCASFTRRGFHFDACAHSLGSCREDGNIFTMIKELEINNIFNIKRYDPSDVIITPDSKISFYSDLNRTIKEFQDVFPKETDNIQTFFDDVVSFSNASLLVLRKKTFDILLDEYFKDNNLKATLAFPVLGNAGLPPSLISAFSAVLLYREFMIDGGYYPEGGMQVLSDNLAIRFKEFGGDLLLSSLVKEITLNNNKVNGVVTEKKGFISACYIVSACDATQTFLDFFSKENINRNLSDKLNKMKPSLSMFILYLGIDKNFKILFPEGSNVWYLPHYNIEEMYRSAKNRNVSNLEEYMLRISPGKKSLNVFINANFSTKKFWDAHKEKMSKRLVEKIDNILPNLSKHILYKGISTPYSLHRWTLNYRGAAYGWASIPTQLMLLEFSQKTIVSNLFLTGHWTTLAHGIRGVVYSGINTAKVIMTRDSFSKQ